MPSTEELVKAAQVGEGSAFAELVRRYERAAIITAHSILGDFHSSQDAAQEAFIIAYQELEQLRDAALFGPWLLQIARRRALRLQRNRNAERTRTECVDLATTPTNDWMEPYLDVVQQLARLPEHERIVTVMRYVDGHSVKEIAVMLGLKENTVSVKYRRVLQKLRSLFEASVFDEFPEV